MRIVITGGTGMIGQALAKSLGEDGHDIYIASRSPRQSTSLPGTVNFVEYDAKSAEGWVEIVDGSDAIINLAGENLAGSGFLPSRWTPEKKKRIRESRVNVGQAVVAAVEQAENKPGVVIQPSGINYYGTHPISKELTESSPPGDDFLASVCNDWEASTAAVEDMGVRRCVIRTGVVFDSDDGVLPRIALPVKLFVGGPLGSGKQPVPWVHIDDVVRAIRFLIENENLSGAFNLTAPNTPTNAQLMRALGKELGRPTFLPVPGIAFRLAFGEVAMTILEGQNAVPARLQDAGFEFKFPDVESALADLY